MFHGIVHKLPIQTLNILESLCLLALYVAL
jgi:hypothetical protein